MRDLTDKLLLALFVQSSSDACLPYPFLSDANPAANLLRIGGRRREVTDFLLQIFEQLFLYCPCYPSNSLMVLKDMQRGVHTV
jgi:hypothetical protein